MMTKVLVADTFRNSFFTEMMNDNIIKIDNKEAFDNINEKLKDNNAFKLKFMNLLKKNMSNSLGVGESVRKALREIISAEFSIHLGWSGSGNCIKFSETRVCNLLLGKFF